MGKWWKTANLEYEKCKRKLRNKRISSTDVDKKNHNVTKNQVCAQNTNMVHIAGPCKGNM